MDRVDGIEKYMTMEQIYKKRRWACPRENSELSACSLTACIRNYESSETGNTFSIGKVHFIRRMIIRVPDRTSVSNTMMVKEAVVDINIRIRDREYTLEDYLCPSG